MSVPILHTVDPSVRLVVTLCCGAISREDVVASLEKLRKHPDFKPEFHQLADVSLVSSLELNFNDMAVIHRLYDPFSNQGKRAVVAPGRGATLGLARMYQSIVDH